MTLPPSHAKAGLPLAPRRDAAKSARSNANSPLVTAMGSLAVVLALFFVAAWVLRRANPQSAQALPSEVVELLGRAPLPGRQQMHLIRCGNKLLLVCLSPAGAETLTEITDPLEVDRLAGLCRQAHPQSATATFQQIMQQLDRGTAAIELEDQPRSARTLARASGGQRVLREKDHA
jgi:flagellar biogenesis protein FliO